MREAELLVSSDVLGLMNDRTIRLMGKLARRPDFQVTSLLARLYLIVAKQAAQLGIDKTALVNDIFLLAERIRGTESGELLALAGQDLLENLMKHGGLNPEQMAIAQQLLDKQSSLDFETASQAIIEELRADDASSMLKLFDLMSQSALLKEQFDVFSSQLGVLVSTIEPLLTQPEMQYHTFRFLEHFIFQYCYYVKTGTTAQVYTVLDTRYLNDNCFFTALCFVKLLSSAEAPIKASLLRILKRLWFLYPKRRQSLRTPIHEVLRACAVGEPEQGKGAAKFMYYLRNDPEADPDLKSLLESDASLSSLEKFGEYSRGALINPEVESIHSLDQLQVFAGFALSVSIPAGETESYVIEATEPNCILAWGFATKAYDLSYSLSRMDLATPQVIIDQHRIECSHEPVVGAVVLPAPGIYKFIWDNSYSWVRAKYVRYRISLLRPALQTSMIPSVLRGPIALQGGEDDFFVNPVGEILEIGVEIKGLSVALMSENESDQLELETLDELPIAVAGFIERISEPNKCYHRKIGVVEAVFKGHPELSSLGSIAIARDVEAVAWLSYHSLHPTTLIAATLEAPYRSAVINKGRLLADDNGNSLGDLSRLPTNNPAKAVADLLRMFGPATIILVGVNSPTAEFVESVRRLVPAPIWMSSEIRESMHGDKAALEAAYKLQFLRHTYKHTF